MPKTKRKPEKCLIELVDKSGKIYTTISIPVSSLRKFHNNVCFSYNHVYNYKFKSIKLILPKNDINSTYIKLVKEIKRRRKC